MTAQIDKTKWPKVETAQDAFLMYGDEGLRTFLAVKLECGLLRFWLAELGRDVLVSRKEKSHE